MSKPSNPSAFPAPAMWNPQLCEIVGGADGMTLRDYLAAHAPPVPNTGLDDLVAWRYKYADAMLRERERQS